MEAAEVQNQNLEADEIEDLEDDDEDDDSVVETEEGIVEVSAGTRYGEKDPETGKKPKLEASVPFRPGESLTEAVELYGEEPVYIRYRRGVERDLSNAIRSALNKYLEKGTSVDQIPDLVAGELGNWRPDAERRVSRRSPEENILANFSSLSPEKRAEILQRLQEQQTPGVE